MKQYNLSQGMAKSKESAMVGKNTCASSAKRDFMDEICKIKKTNA